VVVSIAGCGGGRDRGGADAGADADLPDPTLVDIPWLAEGRPPIAATPERACPDGFRAERSDTGVATCDPWPETGRAACSGVETHFPGEPGCTRVGTACPAGEWPEGLPTDRPIVYVRAGAGKTGTGSQVSPYTSLGYAVSVAAPESIIAVARGTYDGRVDLFSNVTVWGACPEETILTQSVRSEMDTVVGAFFGGETTLRNVTVRAPVTMGIFVDGGSHVRIEDVVVDGALGYGIYSTTAGTVTDLEHVIVRGATPFADGSGGVGVQIVDGGSGTARRTVIENNSSGLYVASNASGTFERIAVIGSTGGGAEPRSGSAFVVQDHSHAELSASALENNLAGGALVALGAELRATDVVIRDVGHAGDALSAPAIESRVDSTVTFTGLLIERALGGAIVMAENGVLTVEDVVVRDTQPSSVEGFEMGAAVAIQDTATLEVSRALFEHSRRTGILTRPGTSLTARDAVIRQTSASGPRGLGTGMSLFGQSNVLERVIVEQATVVGIAVSDAQTTATMHDVLVRDTRSDPVTGFYGRGLEVNLGAHLSADRLVLESNREVGLASYDPGTSSELTNVLVRDTAGEECGDACPEGPLGYGVSARSGASIVLDGFTITRSRLLGMQIGPEGYIEARRGEISHHVIGVNIQEPTYDFTTSVVGVAFVDNERNLDAAMLPLPDSSLGGE